MDYNMGVPSARACILSHIHELSNSEKCVADYVSANMRATLDMSMMDIADACGVSDATVLRFVRSIGFDGYNAFKLALAADLMKPSEAVFESVKPDDSYELIIQKVIQTDIQLLQTTLDTLDAKALEQAIQAIKAAKHIFIFAVASSEPMAIWLFDRIFRLGYRTTVMTDTYRQLVQAGIAEPDDVYIFLSRSGAPITLAESERIIKRRSPDTKIISIVCDATSPVALRSDICLCGVSYEMRTDIAGPLVAMSSIIDVIYTCLELSDIDRTTANQTAAWDALAILRNAKNRTK